MSAPALSQRGLVAAWRSQRNVALPLTFGILALGLLFHQEVTAAVHVWMTSTAYNHCFLVIPIAAYLAWDRRDTLRGYTAEPVPMVALACIPVAFVWLLAERLGIMEGRQLMVMTFVEVLTLAVLGWRLWWQLAGPLLYLYFLVPFGDFLTPQLQDFTTDFVQVGLNLLHIPAYITGYTIEIPEGTFYIAEACAGLRFLIASIAFGALYALLMYRTTGRRVAFIAASIVVPVIANGIRATGIVTLGHVLGSAQAAATDHVLYGWLFFSLVILLLIALGLPFRQDALRDPDTAPALPPRRPARDEPWFGAALAGTLAVLLAAISPALASQLDRLNAPPDSAAAALDFGPACTDLPVTADAPVELPARVSDRRIRCDGQVFDVRLVVFGTRSTAAPLFSAQRQLTYIPNPTNDENFETETKWLAIPTGPQHLWHFEYATRPGPMVAWAMWVDGRPAAGGLRMRAHLAWESLIGARFAPVVVVVTPEENQLWLTRDEAAHTQQNLIDLLARTDLTAQIPRIAAPQG